MKRNSSIIECYDHGNTGYSSVNPPPSPHPKEPPSHNLMFFDVHLLMLGHSLVHEPIKER